MKSVSFFLNIAFKDLKKKTNYLFFLRLGNLFSNHKPSFYLSTYTCTISSLIKPTLSNFQILQNQFGTRWCLVKMKGTQWLSRINKNITKHSTEFVAIAFYTNLISFVFFLYKWFISPKIHISNYMHYQTIQSEEYSDNNSYVLLQSRLF